MTEGTAKTWTVRSKTSLGLVYTVTLVDDAFSCTCPDFQFRGGTCKHIKKVKQLIAGEKQKDKLPEEIYSDPQKVQQILDAAMKEGVED